MRVVGENGENLLQAKISGNTLCHYMHSDNNTVVTTLHACARDKMIMIGSVVIVVIDIIDTEINKSGNRASYMQVT